MPVTSQIRIWFRSHGSTQGSRSFLVTSIVGKPTLSHRSCQVSPPECPDMGLCQCNITGHGTDSEMFATCRPYKYLLLQ